MFPFLEGGSRGKPHGWTACVYMLVQQNSLPPHGEKSVERQVGRQTRHPQTQRAPRTETSSETNGELMRRQVGVQKRNTSPETNPKSNQLLRNSDGTLATVNAWRKMFGFLSRLRVWHRISFLQRSTNTCFHKRFVSGVNVGIMMRNVNIPHSDLSNNSHSQDTHTHKSIHKCKWEQN